MESRGLNVAHDFLQSPDYAARRLSLRLVVRAESGYLGAVQRSSAKRTATNRTRARRMLIFRFRDVVGFFSGG